MSIRRSHGTTDVKAPGGNNEDWYLCRLQSCCKSIDYTRQALGQE